VQAKVRCIGIEGVAFGIPLSAIKEKLKVKLIE